MGSAGRLEPDFPGSAFVQRGTGRPGERLCSSWGYDGDSNAAVRGGHVLNMLSIYFILFKVRRTRINDVLDVGGEREESRVTPGFSM